MAAVNLDTTMVKLTKDTHTADMTSLAAVAGDATDGCFFTPSKGNEHYLIYAINSSADTDTYSFTVKAGDSPMFGGSDLASGAIVHGKDRLISIPEIGPYLITTGTNKGKIKIAVSNAAIKLAVIQLPT
jgi:hypothetical protein